MNKNQILNYINDSISKEVSLRLKVIEDPGVVDKINEIIDKIDTLETAIVDYGKAIQFISWFDFDKLYSDKLRKEAKSKLYTELTTKSFLPHISKIRRKDNSNSSIGVIDAVNDYNWRDDRPVLCCDRRDSEIKYVKQVNFKDTVEYAVQRPFELYPSQVIAVADYLRTIVKKDAEIKKYS